MDRHAAHNRLMVLVLMGVSGSGKTTVGKLLTERLGLGSRELISRGMAARKGHFMPAALLDTQFATLQEPSADERPITVDIGGTPSEIVDGDRVVALTRTETGARLAVRRSAGALPFDRGRETAIGLTESAASAPSSMKISGGNSTCRSSVAKS